MPQKRNTYQSFRLVISRRSVTISVPNDNFLGYYITCCRCYCHIWHKMIVFQGSVSWHLIKTFTLLQWYAEHAAMFWLKAVWPTFKVRWPSGVPDAVMNMQMNVNNMEPKVPWIFFCWGDASEKGWISFWERMQHTTNALHSRAAENWRPLTSEECRWQGCAKKSRC